MNEFNASRIIYYSNGHAVIKANTKKKSNIKSELIFYFLMSWTNLIQALSEYITKKKKTLDSI